MRCLRRRRARYLRQPDWLPLRVLPEAGDHRVDTPDAIRWHMTELILAVRELIEAERHIEFCDKRKDAIEVMVNDARRQLEEHEKAAWVWDGRVEAARASVRAKHAAVEAWMARRGEGT